MTRWTGSRGLLPWTAFALLLLLAPLLFASSQGLDLLAQMGIAIIACLSYNILLGQGGMLSFGHAAYTGAGAFLAIHTLNKVGQGWPLPVSLVPLAGGLAGLLLALLLGWVSTRRSGTPFAMITLAVGELVWATSLLFPEVFGGEAGVSGNRVAGARPFGVSFGPPVQTYYLIAGYTFVCSLLMFAFTRTPLGRMLNAVRDNPQRAAFLGYDPHMVRYLAFAVSAFFAGIAGGLGALNFEIVTSEVFSSHRSGAYLLFTFLGGSAYFAGPILGGVLMVLAFAWLSGVTQAWLLYVGLAFMGMVMLAPGGIGSLVAANLDLARAGRLRPWLGLYVALAAALLTAIAGAAAIVEMVYHWQLESVLGSRVAFMGLALDARGPATWMYASLAMLAGLAAFVPLRRRFARRWREMHREAAPAQTRPGAN